MIDDVGTNDAESAGPNPGETGAGGKGSDGEASAYRKGAEDMRRKIEARFRGVGWAGSLRLCMTSRINRPVREISAEIRRVPLPEPPK